MANCMKCNILNVFINYLFQSRNGTYVNHAEEIKHYTKDDGRVALQNGDVICFGFNIGSVYDINDPNVFTYLLKKEAIVTIDLDSDDECTAQTSRQADTTEQQDNVFEIDSDSEHSGDECFEDIDDVEDESEQSNEPYSSDENEIDESSNASSVGSFVVTKTILNPLTPPDGEIVELSDDESTEITSSEQFNDKKSQDDNVGNQQQKPDSTSDESEMAHTAEACDEPSSSAAISVSDASTSAAATTAAINEGSHSPSAASNNNQANIPNDEQNRLAKVRRRIAEKSQKKISVTNAQPIRKRRRTYTENEYKRKVEKIDPQEVKRVRLERLAKIAADKKAEKDAHGEGSGEQQRTQFVPRVKNTSVSRSAMLSEDMLQTDP